jgi:hypothetical protein
MLLRDWSYDPASAHPLLLTPLHTRNIAYRAAYTDPDYGRIVPEPVYVSSLDVRLIPSATLADDIGDIQLAATDGARRRYYQAGRSITETDAAMLIADRFAETGTDLIDYIDTFNGSFSRERDTEIREWARLLIETAASIGRYPSVRHALLAQLAPAIPTPSTAVAVERYRDTLTEPGFIASAQLAQNAADWQHRTGQNLGLDPKPDGSVIGARRLFAALDLPAARRRIDGRIVRGYLIP